MLVYLDSLQYPDHLSGSIKSHIKGVYGKRHGKVRFEMMTDDIIWKDWWNQEFMKDKDGILLSTCYKVWDFMQDHF